MIVRGDARRLPLSEGSVSCIVTSPPYFALRSYRDGGEHFQMQIGSEETPAAFVEALLVCAEEWRRVLRPDGCVWVNLGDKYVSGTSTPRSNITSPAGYGNEKNFNPTDRRLSEVEAGARVKSLMGLPWRFAIAMIDNGWILRQEVVWSKPNGLPESVTDRPRRSHEQWFMFTKEPRYYAALDELREPHEASTWERAQYPTDKAMTARNAGPITGGQNKWNGPNPLGRLPGSVRSVPTEPLVVPQSEKDRLGLPDHFAAFPQAWPEWILTGFAPLRGICVVCDEGLRPVVEREFRGEPNRGEGDKQQQRAGGTQTGGTANVTLGRTDDVQRQITGYACPCGPEGTTPTRPPLVLDPFGGTGTVAGVARKLGANAVSVDLSHDYSRLAAYLLGTSRFGKSERKAWERRQGSLL